MNLSGFARKTAHGALRLPRRHRVLREKRGYEGDLSASINDALLAVNLNTVELVTLQGKTKQTARETQVVLCWLSLKWRGDVFR
jgi:hypothetical protein